MENTEQEEKTIKISTLFKYLWKNIILFVAVCVAVIAMGFIYTFALVKPTYESSATFALKVTDKDGKTDYVNSFRVTESVATLVKQDGVLGEVAKDYEMDRAQLSKMVTVSYGELNYFLTVSVQSGDKEQTQILANALAAKLESVTNSENSPVECFIAETTAADVGTYVSPNKTMYVLVSVVAGLALGCAVVAVKVLASKKYISSEQIEERLSAKVFGYFPVDKEKEKKNKGKKDVNATEEVEVLDCNVNNYEPYNALLNNIGYNKTKNSHNAIMVTSSCKNEMKGTIVCNLSNCIAYNGHKVAILDLDMRNPIMYKVYNVSEETGVVDLINGECAFDDVIKHTDCGVDIITAGKNIVNPMAVIGHKSLPELIKKLKGMYEYVLINASPVLSCADCAALAPICDGVLFNIAMSDVNKKMAENAVKTLKMGGANIIGLNVIKGTESKIESKYYDSFNGNGVRTEPEMIAEAAVADESNSKND